MTTRSLYAIAFALVLAGSAAPAAQAPTFSITLTGQSMIRSDIRTGVPAAVPVITSLLKGDVVFTNFETTILDVKKGQSPKDGRFLSPPETLEALKTFGFNLVSLANNHAWDLKVPGIENTLAQAQRIGLTHAGTGMNVAEAVAPGYLRTPKGTVALIAMASGLIAEGGSATPTRAGVNELRVENNKPNPEDSKRILDSIRTASRQADLVVVYEHNHVFDKPFLTMMGEELPERLVPPDWLKKWTHDEIDAGADIIVMHGAPLLHGVEIYRGKPIFYGLGSFSFHTGHGGRKHGDWVGMMARVVVDSGKTSASFRFVRHNDNNETYFPNPDAEQATIEDLKKRGSAFGTKYTIQGEEVTLA